MLSDFPLHNTTLTSQSSLSTVDSADDSLIDRHRLNEKINKSLFSELSSNNLQEYSAYFLQKSCQGEVSDSLAALKKEPKKSYYWKIYELAVLYMVRFFLEPTAKSRLPDSNSNLNLNL